VVAYLGQLDEAGRLGLRHADAGGSTCRQRTFADETEPEWVTVDTAAVRVENCLQFGGPWLALELIRKLGLHTFLERTLPSGNEAVPWSLTALILILSRLCEPSSELHIAEHFYRETALPELLGVPIEKVDDNRLYRGLDHLLPHKAALEAFLKNRLGELLELEYDLLLYARSAQRLQAGLHRPGRITLRSVDVVLPNSTGTHLRKRCVTKPTEHQAILLDRLCLRLPSRLKIFQFEM